MAQLDSETVESLKAKVAHLSRENEHSIAEMSHWKKLALLCSASVSGDASLMASDGHASPETDAIRKLEEELSLWKALVLLGSGASDAAPEREAMIRQIEDLKGLCGAREARIEDLERVNRELKFLCDEQRRQIEEAAWRSQTGDVVLRDELCGLQLHNQDLRADLRRCEDALKESQRSYHELLEKKESGGPAPPDTSGDGVLARMLAEEFGTAPYEPPSRGGASEKPSPSQGGYHSIHQETKTLGGRRGARGWWD